MQNVKYLLEKVKSITEKIGLKFVNNNNVNYKNYLYSDTISNEIKAEADSFLETEIFKHLIPLGVPILSEESGYLEKDNDEGYLFIVDPLDGTMNFVRGIGQYAISIALWKNNEPIFGVIYDLSSKKLSWGGKFFGAYHNDSLISVSSVSDKRKAVICTGFPARFDINSSDLMKCFWNKISVFSKIRMIGCASVSLVYVASGKADMYFEKNIMLWDVAAGLAILDGAGGEYSLNATSVKWSFDIEASNGNL